MKKVTSRHIKIAFMISILASSIYLFGWLLTHNLAIVQYASKGQLPIGFIKILDGDKIETQAVMILARGWPGVIAFWPQLLALTLIATGSIFFLGEKILKISNKKIFEDAVREANELETSATKKLLCCYAFARRNNLELEDLFPKP